MIITFTGPQCSGKTTLLKRMKEKDFIDRFFYVEEVTRLVKREFNVSINEEGANDKVQTLILNKEFENLFIDPKPWPDCKGIVHDRCLLDGALFTEYFYEQDLKKKSNQRDGFYLSKTLGFQYWMCNYKKYDIIFYPDPHDVKLVADGERSTNVEFRNAIIEKYEEYWHRSKWMHEKQLVILKGTVEERMEQIKIVLNERGIYSK
ncbi:hypothetical protein EBR43_02205 [bacterium]|nr:hypothetical protein [bacterium]